MTDAKAHIKKRTSELEPGDVILFGEGPLCAVRYFLFAPVVVGVTRLPDINGRGDWDYFIHICITGKIGDMQVTEYQDLVSNAYERSFDTAEYRREFVWTLRETK